MEGVLLRQRTVVKYPQFTHCPASNNPQSRFSAVRTLSLRLSSLIRFSAYATLFRAWWSSGVFPAMWISCLYAVIALSMSSRCSKETQSALMASNVSEESAPLAARKSSNRPWKIWAASRLRPASMYALPKRWITLRASGS